MLTSAITIVIIDCMKPLETLDAAIEAAGGVSALARELGTTQATVSNWRMRGSVPNGWLMAIRLKYRKQLAQKQKTEA